MIALIVALTLKPNGDSKVEVNVGNPPLAPDGERAEADVMLGVMVAIAGGLRRGKAVAEAYAHDELILRGGVSDRVKRRNAALFAASAAMDAYLFDFVRGTNMEETILKGLNQQ